jgi:hypothetical protein
MKRGFLITEGGCLVSALIQRNVESVLRTGDRIMISRPLDLGYEAQIAPGWGTVDHVDASTGAAEILLDEHYPGLSEWRNHIWLEPFGTEDILSGIVCFCTAEKRLDAA